MERSEAIKIVSKLQLQHLTSEERADQLEVMLLENWEDTVGWKKLPSDIQHEFENEELLSNADESKYDCILLLWLEDELKAVTNEFLLHKLKETSNFEGEIEGTPTELISCPCCGYRTLNEPSSYDICNVCWWEDDGQGNNDADIAMGGPNYGISLTKARFNFLTKGIYDPERKDLIKLKKPKEMFAKGREFILKDDNTITELGTNKSWRINND